MKKLLALLLIVVLMMAAAGCTNSKQSAAPETVNFKAAALKGPTAVGMVKMMDSNPSMGENVKVDYVIEPSPDTLTAKLLTGEVEFATIPTNSAAILYNKGVAYKLVAMNTWGVMYVVSSDPSIKTWADLKGKSIDAATKGSAGDVVFRYLLSKNGIDPAKDVSLQYITSPVEQAQLAIAGKSAISVLPEPWVSTVLSKNPNLKVALDLQQEWKRINGADVQFAQTCLVVETAFAQKYPQIVDKFLQEYAASIDWVNKNPAEAGALVGKKDLGIPADVAVGAIPRCNIRYMSAMDAKPVVDKYLQVLLDFSPNTVGGKLPDANFFYQK